LRIKKGIQTVGDPKSELIREMQEELFLKQGQGWFRIISGSMQPLFDVHDRVLAERVNSVNLRPGNIILFKNSHALVTHRVMKKYYEMGQLLFLQRGDAGGPAGLIPAESVIGKIVALEKNGTVLRLDRGKGRIIDTFFGITNCSCYRSGIKVAAIKKQLRDKCGFHCLKLLYRAVKKPFILLNRAMVKVFTSGISMGARSNLTTGSESNDHQNRYV
jgi:signal peptidase I